LVSLIFITFFISVIFYFIKDKFKESKKLILFLVLGIFVLVNFLYFTNLIPPIPLSLKDAGVYHSIQKNGEGNYIVTAENHSWKEYFNLYPNFEETVGSPVYAFSAIFSPKNLNLAILHEWQHYDEVQKKWLTEFTINLGVIGGRDGGFRTYSSRSNISPGKWRVNVKTQSNQTMGSIRFNIVPVDIAPMLKIEVK
jgi:hypothetical protein